MRINFPILFFSKKEKHEILQAIRQAESKTSGEIRIRVQRSTDDNILGHAAHIFERMGMANTLERNGVLILFGLKKRRFALAADKGIFEKVPQNFWDDIVKVMSEEFKKDHFATGLSHGIRLIGEKLQDYFPVPEKNANELPDRISYSWK